MHAPNTQGAAPRVRPNFLRSDYPETIRSARHAASIWFQSKTGLTLSQFRNVRCAEHCERHQDSGIERHLRESAFCKAYAEQVGQIIVDRYETPTS